MYYFPTTTMSITISRITGEKREFKFSSTLTFGEIQKVLWCDDGFNCSSFFKEGVEDKIPIYLTEYRRIHNNATMDSLGITPETKLFALPSGGDEPHAREFITLTMNEPSGRTRTIRISYNESILCLSNYWKNEFGSYVGTFFIEGVEDPLNWKYAGKHQTLADNDIRSDKNIFVIETDKWRCSDCGGTTTWRGICIGCYPGDLQDLCIHGDGIVSLRDGTTSRVKDLLVGDTVQTVGGFTQIRKKTTSEPRIRKMSTIGRAIVTHDHPVCIDDEWVMPFEFDPSGVETYSCVVYNFVMDADPADKDKHTIIVNDVICATLGRGPENLARRFPDADRKFGSGFWKHNHY